MKSLFNRKIKKLGDPAKRRIRLLTQAMKTHERWIARYKRQIAKLILGS